jgi:hypothetical protein
MQRVQGINRCGVMIGALRIRTPVAHDQVGVEEPALYLGVAGLDYFNSTVVKTDR